ncbi:hypothetical protein D9758_012497 [Tetrapyrgos nigripes]|uniref:Transmembrane protein n=1 Tax=Tetrapyrgos nigripes TaxID=182062 RepID=A0A8H5G381_9AGAR|nr:hypothetical protein D9758_012497 [Tetrapyrgos nigripes]
MNQSALPGWLFVDDTDARLHYSPAGKWQLSNGSTPQSGNETLDNGDVTWGGGKIWNNTVHGTTSDGGNVTFVFNGTGYSVYGSYLFPGPSPKGRISCFLDGNPVADYFTDWPKDRDPDTMLGNIVFTCGSPTSQGEHELVINVDSLVNSSFYLDYILYEPISAGLEGEDAEEVMMMIGNPLTSLFDESSEHHIVEFSVGWSVGSPNNDVVNVVTRTPGASVTVDFNGTSIQLYGDLGVGSNLSNSAIYQLDDQPEQSFPLVPPFDGYDVFLVRQFLNLSGLSPTQEHRLVVSHNGSEEGMALSLDFFAVNRVFSGTVVPLTHSSPSPSAPASVTTGKNHLNAGELGGIIGGAVVLLVLCGIGTWLWLTSRRKARNKRLSLDPTPFVRPVVTMPDINPYEMETQMISPSDTIACNPYKRSRTRSSIRSPPIQTSSSEGDDIVNQLRWGNLKLQQRLAVHMGGNQGAESPGEPDFEAVTVERPQLVIHADSGWRIERRRAVQEVPPTYTEA